MRKVGILGGTFDPIHYGHIALARAALEEYGLDEVRVMTGGMPPHKRGVMTDADMRYEMSALALADEEKIIPFDFEISETEYTYTAKTLTKLKKIHTDWEIYFIIGEDSLRDLPSWYDPQTVTDNCILLVYPRDDMRSLIGLAEERRGKYGADIRLISAPIVTISSTDIRSRVKNGEPIEGLVPKKVLEYIKEKGLYIE